MKKCYKCKVVRKLEYFSKKNGWGENRVGMCKFCHAEYDKERRKQKKLDNLYSF
jgi:hypothetical protein